VVGRIIEIIVLLLVLRTVWKVLANLFTVSAGAMPSTTTGEPRAVKLVRDPVCGTYVSPDLAIADGKNYFCSEKCRDEYRSQTRATESRRHGA